MRFGVVLAILFIICPVLAQDSLFVSPPDTLDFSPTLMRSWRKAYPFTKLSDEAYSAAIADTTFIVAKRRTRQTENKYSDAKRAADSLMAQVRCIAYDPKMYIGLRDYRMPIFATSEIPVDKQLTILDLANDYSSEHWSYIRPADYKMQQSAEAHNLRAVSIYNYVKEHPSRYSFPQGNIVLPPSIQQEEVSAIKTLEGKSLGLGEGVETYVKIGGNIQSQIKTDRWHHVGSSLLQMSQTALSDNWYKGGDNNMTVSTVQKLSLTTYDENKKSSIDILLELRLSALYTKADTIHPLRANDNIFSASFKYGYQAWKRWYYSSLLYAKTPVFDFYNTNSKVTKTTFLAPLETNLSVGMEYKYISKNKSLNYSLLLAPLAYNLKYVRPCSVDPKSFGIDEGKNTLHKFGSTVSSSLTWSITPTVSWTSRLYYFTSYDNIQVEFENTFNFVVSRRFTCQLYLYPRFDDSFDEKVQMKEMLTFGINYVW